MILNTSIKYWPAEYHSQSAIEAALFLREQIGDVSQMRQSRSNPRCLGRYYRERAGKMETGNARNGRPQPAIHYCDCFNRWQSDRQAISALAIYRSGDLEISENVKVTRNAELSSLYPGAVANIVHVTLKDGRTLTKRVDYPLGNAKNPVSDVELERKFLHLVAPALGRDHSAKILDQAWSLDQHSGVHHLVKSLKMR